MTMEQNELKKLRDLPIEEVAQRLGLHVERHRCLCPFHDDTHPSLSFNVRKNTFRCFVCGASGGTIDLVMRYLGIGFREACQWLAQGSSIIITQHHAATACKKENTFNAARYARYFERPSLGEAARNFLFAQRHIHPRVAQWCRLSSWRDANGNNWLQIPYFAADGALTGIQNRNLNYRKDGDTPRFIFPRGSRCGIYNLPVIRLLRQGEPLFITEGCSDCWAMLSAGHKAIAIPSATLLNTADANMLAQLGTSRATTFHMYPDNDEPGERLFIQLKAMLPSLVHHHLPPGCKDCADFFVSQENNAAHG